MRSCAVMRGRSSSGGCLRGSMGRNVVERLLWLTMMLWPRGREAIIPCARWSDSEGKGTDAASTGLKNDAELKRVVGSRGVTFARWSRAAGTLCFSWSVGAGAVKPGLKGGPQTYPLQHDLRRQLQTDEYILFSDQLHIQQPNFIL